MGKTEKPDNKPKRGPYTGRFMPKRRSHSWIGTLTCDAAAYMGRIERNLLVSLEADRPGKPDPETLYCDAPEGIDGARKGIIRKTKLMSFQCVMWMRNQPRADVEAWTAIAQAFPFKRRKLKKEETGDLRQKSWWTNETPIPDQPQASADPPPPPHEDRPEEIVDDETIQPDAQADAQPKHDDRHDAESTGLVIPEKYRRIHTICKATPGHIGGRETMVVDARDLYEGLGVRGTEFRHWLKRRVTGNAELTEAVDYELYEGRSNVTGLEAGGAQKTKECRLTIDAAKRISMAEGGDVGKLVRSYYLWTEGVVEEVVAQQQVPNVDNGTLAMMTKMMEFQERMLTTIMDRLQTKASDEPETTQGWEPGNESFTDFCRHVPGLTVERFSQERSAEGAIVQSMDGRWVCTPAATSADPKLLTDRVQFRVANNKRNVDKYAVLTARGVKHYSELYAKNRNV